jgi:hypothetical protein
MKFTKNLDIIAEPDVLVCGCGCAGTAAAIAAGRYGASTMAVERWGFAGGFITAVMGSSLDGFVDLRSNLPIVGGIVFEFARLAGGITGDIASIQFRPSNEVRELKENPDKQAVHFDFELFKLHADRLLQKAGVDLLYHTYVVDVLREGDRITGVVIVNKGGMGIVKPKMVIDATGDADVVARAGLAFDIDEEMQPMSLHFRVGNIKNISYELRMKCSEVLKNAREEGKLDLYAGPWMAQINPGELYFNATRFAGNGVDPEDVTRAEVQGREDARLMFELFKERLPEFKDAYFVSTGPSVGQRETRRIKGDGTLSVDDAYNSHPQKDVVVMGAWYVDRHPKGSSGYHMHEVIRPYDISYRTMLPQGLSNTLAAGRCHAAESGALASSRVTVTAMGMGQAAGTAAAMAAEGKNDSRELDVAALQTRLLEDDVIILDRAAKVLKVGDDLGDSAPTSAIR